MSKNKLNGSADLLANAIRQVFLESMEGVESRVDGKLDGLSQDMVGNQG